ncbi:hypothetical protein PKOR_18965 [Pontibacter korlensis]|uniref:Uncharacterized protein n=2 Tax=Pontibacter korlensis TaxID=400092 RepID=A0A0E3UYW4_9BACT|nr:hypothetical protein PKOR_18965 [Pontibacter korlensis]
MYEFSSGEYKVHLPAGETCRAYVDVEEASLSLLPVLGNTLDTTASLDIAVAEVLDKVAPQVYTFSKPSFDLDVLTIPFKYRPGTSGFPQQLSTTFQGAIYVGARKDVFRIGYKPTPAQDLHRSIYHFGYSIGFFTGLGTTSMNQWVTQGAIAYEHVGVTLLNGVAGVVGLYNFTLGLAVGIDHLFDKTGTTGFISINLGLA